jgi:hypothetical protein
MTRRLWPCCGERHCFAEWRLDARQDGRLRDDRPDGLTVWDRLTAAELSPGASKRTRRPAAYRSNHYNSHREWTLGQAAPRRPLPQRTTSEANTVRQRDRLGGLLHEIQQVAGRVRRSWHPQDDG